MKSFPPACRTVFVMTALFMLLSTGCMQRGFEMTYTPELPESMPRTSNPRIFHYYDVNAEKIYKTFFTDYLIIGRSSFEGPYNDPMRLYEFAKEVGAHVVVTSSSLTESRSHDMMMDMPTTPTISVVGGEGAGPASYHTTGTVSHQRMRMNLNIFSQKALFLRKVKDTPALWEINKAQLSEMSTAQKSGCYVALNAKMEAYKMNGRTLGFYAGNPDSVWKPGDLKFIIYDGDKLSGVFMMEDKTPQLAKYRILPNGSMKVSLPLAEKEIPLDKSSGCQ